MPEPPPWSQAKDADDTPIPRQDFTVEHELQLFPLDMCEITCPDCSRAYYPDSLGEALDWALGHKCDPEWDTPSAPPERKAER